MIAVRYILLFALAFTLQTTWVNFLKVWSVQPDLLIIMLNYIALRSGPVVGTYMGLGFGILQDIYLPADLGINALVKSLIGAGLGYSHARMVDDSIQAQTVLVFVAVILHDLIYYLIYYLGSSADLPFEVINILGRAVYTSLISAVFFAGLTLKRHLFPA